MIQKNVSNAYSFQNVLNSATNKEGPVGLVNCMFQFLCKKKSKKDTIYYELMNIDSLSYYILSDI